MQSTLYGEYLLFTQHTSAARYRSTATGGDPPRRGKILKRLSVLQH